MATLSDDGAASLVGRKVENRALIRFPGEGALGAVTEAQNLTIGGRRAVKLPHSHLALHGELRRRFLDEASAASRAGHAAATE